MSYKELKEIVRKYKEKVLVDNDFERAYTIPFDAFDKVDKKDLIELVFVYRAILDENEVPDECL